MRRASVVLWSSSAKAWRRSRDLPDAKAKLTMLSFRRPNDGRIQAMLAAVADADFSYDAIGCVRRETPQGFNRDREMVVLGQGEEVWDRAIGAVRAWAVFPSDMVAVVRLADEIKVGNTLATVCYAAGVWTVNPTRILSVTDESAVGRNRFGFAFGTLPGHVEQGEERFLVEWDKETDQVTYTIEAVSRPRHFLTWLAYPYTRLMQAKFRRLSCLQMQALTKQVAANKFSADSRAPASLQT